MRYWNGYQWKNGQAPQGSGRITECATIEEFKQVFGERAEETDEELKERIRDAFVPPPRSDIEGYYVGESHPAFPSASGLAFCTEERRELHARLDALASVPPAIDRNTGEPYATGLERTVSDDEHRLNIQASVVTSDPAVPKSMIKLGCHACTFTWEEPDRDDMILTPDHTSHFTEPCEGSGEPAICL